MYLSKVTKYLYFVTFHHWLPPQMKNKVAITIQSQTYN